MPFGQVEIEKNEAKYILKNKAGSGKAILGISKYSQRVANIVSMPKKEEKFEYM